MSKGKKPAVKRPMSFGKFMASVVALVGVTGITVAVFWFGFGVHAVGWLVWWCLLSVWVFGRDAYDTLVEMWT